MNGENAAADDWITPRLAEVILASGTDVITLGNHAFRRPEIAGYLAESDRVIRPANLEARARNGLTFAESRDGQTVAVVNLLGQLFLAPPHGPWGLVDELVEERGGGRRHPRRLHGEATSEEGRDGGRPGRKVTTVIARAHPDERRARPTPAARRRSRTRG